MANKKKKRRRKKQTSHQPPPIIAPSPEKKPEQESLKKNRRPLIFVLAVVALIVVLVTLFLPKNRISVSPREGMNVLLITLDTTRADRIGAYGYIKGETPNLDFLAAQGVRFANAYCQVPLTLPSHVSLMTGTFPVYHHVHNNGFYYLDPGLETMAEIFKKNGYATAAFVSSFTLDSRFGIDQGFDVYSDSLNEGEMIKGFRSERGADSVFDSFFGWADQGLPEKFFCWVHFFDPHLPYNPPSPYREKFIAEPYDGEVAYMDNAIGRVIETLREKGVLESTLIILAGDHGEALGEKGEVDHGLFLYEPTMRIPLIINASSVFPEGMVVDASVRLIDILPTLLEAVRMPVPENIQGESLIPFIKGKKKSDLPTYIETVYPRENYGWSELTGLIEDGWKFIRAPKSELYNLRQDPGEEQNLIDREAGLARSMNEKLTGLVESLASQLETRKRELSLEEQARLRSLGYLGGTEASSSRTGPLPDPKDKMDEFLMIFQAKNAEAEGNFAGAAELFEKILEESPDFEWNYINLAGVYVKLNRLQDGIALLERGIIQKPNSQIILSTLAHFHMRAGELDKALEVSLRALEVNPQFLNGLIIAGLVKYNFGRWAEALEYFEKALAVEPENKIVRMRYAYSLGALGRSDDAVAVYNRLKEEYPDDARIYSDLGVVYNSVGNMEKALEHFKRAVDLDPSPGTYLMYAAVLERSGNLQEAVRYLKLYLENTPEKDTPRKINARRALAEWERRIRKRP